MNPAAQSVAATQGEPTVVVPLVAHAPCTHETPAGHACAHEPQCALSVTASTSQPFAALLSQSSRAKRQSLVHREFEQVVPGHAAPHAPQSVGDEVRSTHRLPHSVSGGAQVAAPSRASATSTRFASVGASPSPPPSTNCAYCDRSYALHAAERHAPSATRRARNDTAVTSGRSHAREPDAISDPGRSSRGV